jgi:hypothetical protein
VLENDVGGAAATASVRPEQKENPQSSVTFSIAIVWANRTSTRWWVLGHDHSNRATGPESAIGANNLTGAGYAPGDPPFPALGHDRPFLCRLTPPSRCEWPNIVCDMSGQLSNSGQEFREFERRRPGPHGLSRKSQFKSEARALRATLELPRSSKAPCVPDFQSQDTPNMSRPVRGVVRAFPRLGPQPLFCIGTTAAYPRLQAAQLRRLASTSLWTWPWSLSERAKRNAFPTGIKTLHHPENGRPVAEYLSPSPETPVPYPD